MRRPALGRSALGRSALGRPALAAGAVLAAQLFPALTSVAPRRRPAVLPRLCGVSREHHLALTFDDGPDAVSTPRVLDVLDRYDVRATFFLLGAHVAQHADLVAEMSRRGHELAVHGWDHTAAPVKRPGALRRELRRTVEAVGDASGVVPAWYRPPYGVLTTEAVRAARDAGLRTVLWSAWGVDWAARATPETVVQRVLRDARPGATVLLHDTDRTSAPGSWRVTVAATEDLLSRWAGLGLPVGPLAEHGL